MIEKSFFGEQVMVVMDGQNQIPRGDAARRRSRPNVSNVGRKEDIQKDENNKKSQGSSKFIGNHGSIDKGRVLAEQAAVDNAIKALFLHGVNEETDSHWNTAEAAIKERASFIQSFDPKIKDVISSLNAALKPLDLGNKFITEDSDLIGLQSTALCLAFNTLNKYLIEDTSKIDKPFSDLKISDLNLPVSKSVMFDLLAIIDLYREKTQKSSVYSEENKLKNIDQLISGFNFVPKYSDEDLSLMTNENLEKAKSSEAKEIRKASLNDNRDEKSREEFLAAIYNGESVVNWKLMPNQDLSSFGLWLAGADLSGVNFNGANLDNAIFFNCKFDESVFIDCSMKNVNFEACSLKDCIFLGAELKESVSMLSDFSNANFLGADMTSKVFKSPVLSGVRHFDALNLIMDHSVTIDRPLANRLAA